MVMRSCVYRQIVVIWIFILQDVHASTDIARGTQQTGTRGGWDASGNQCKEGGRLSLDLVSLMQGARLHISTGDPTSTKEMPNSAKPAEEHMETGSSGGASAHLNGFIHTRADQIMQKAFASFLHVHAALNQRATVMGNAGLTIMMLLLIVGTIACVICICAPKRNNRLNDCHDSQSGSVVGRWAAASHGQWSAPQSHLTMGGDSTLPSFGQGGTQNSFIRPESTNQKLQGTGTFNIWRSPAPSQASLQQAGGDPFNLSPRILPNLPPSPSARILPPPLCPTLVLPVCEARFGMRMQDLAHLTSEGELGIVGLSGNTLLRAAMKVVSGQRMLEISMPEANSAPRATVGPSLLGSRSLEIRGLRGAFYGTLEMRSSGACYVVRDGITVMNIDGNTDSLQLSIRSGQGIELASVRVSTDLFGGAEHVEVRVEPGVDTVLVLSCVLAVLLLSP